MTSRVVRICQNCSGDYVEYFGSAVVDSRALLLRVRASRNKNGEDAYRVPSSQTPEERLDTSSGLRPAPAYI